MKNLLRAGFLLIIIAFSAIITAEKCSKREVILTVKSLDESAVKITETSDEITVHVLETKLFGKTAAKSQDYMGYKEKGVLKNLFTVAIHNASTGIIFSNALSQTSSIKKMSAKVAHQDKDISPRGDFASTNLDEVIILSTWLQGGFVPGSKKPTKIGMICNTPFDTIAGERLKTIVKDASTAQDASDPKAAKAAKERLIAAKEQLTARIATCSMGGQSIKVSDYKGWAQAAKDDPKGVREIELFFGAINFESETLGDLFRILFLTAPDTPLGNITPAIMQEGVLRFFSGTKKVKVVIVPQLP